MPNVVIDFLEGRTIEQKREMAKRVTDAIVETLTVNQRRYKLLCMKYQKTKLLMVAY